MDLHKNKIIKELQFKHEPVVLYGDEAFAFVSKYVPAYDNKSDKQILCSAGGYFLYEKLPQDYVNTGVVCIFNGKIGTLAHELRHAKQFQDNNKWMQRGKWLKFLYKIGYASTYLQKSKLYNLAFLYKLKILSVIFFETRIFWPIYIFFYIYYIQWLYQLVN